MHALRPAFLPALLGLLLAACATSGALTPSASVTTLMAGWERHFGVEWMAEPEGSDARRLRGTLSVFTGEPVMDLRLLGQALDAEGRVIGQRLAWAGDVGGSGRVSFEIPHLPAAERYRVAVWDYTSLQADGKE